MPRGLKSHSNERIDLEDFRQGTRDYVDDRNAFNTKALMLARRSRFVEGFRIEISDQTTNPGEISVFNGLAFARNGELLNNEDQVNDSRTVTLVGASQYFYLELEYIEDDADPDARAFWDSVYDNPSPDPDGREFTLTVPTRLAPNWHLVTPVSTTGFEATSDPSSTRIPLAILHTNASNQIDGPGTIVQVVAASVLEQDVASGVGSIRVLNSRLFPDTGSIIVDVSGTTPETVTVTSNDRDNGILTFAPNLAASHLAGAIVKVTGVTGRYIQENTDPNVVAVDGATSTTTDARRRVFQGDERRGAAVAQSKETFGARDDLNVENIKDFVDFLSAHMHEVRWGTMRPDVVSAAPPTTFNAAPRYWESAGGIQGARYPTVSIGDGLNSWGDFNGTTDAVFTSALAAMPSTGGILVVKRGTYAFSNSVAVTKPVVIMGQSKSAVTIQKGTPAQCFTFVLSDPSYVAGVTDMSFTLGGAATTAPQLTIGTGTYIMRNLSVTGTVQTTNGQSSRVIADNCVFNHNTALDTLAAFLVVSGSELTYSNFRRCDFIGSEVTSTEDGIRVLGSISEITFNGCLITGYHGIYATEAYRMSVNDCNMAGVLAFRLISGGTDILFANTSVANAGATSTTGFRVGGYVLNFNVRNCFFNHTWSNTQSLTVPNASIYFDNTTMDGVSVVNCAFRQATGGARYAAGVYLVGTDSSTMAFRVTGCDFYRVLGVVDVASVASSKFIVSGCNFNGGDQNKTNHGIYADPVAASLYTVSDCRFSDMRDDTAEVAGLFVDGTGGACRLSLTNCDFNDIQQTAGAIASAVKYSLGSSGVATISNLTISGVLGATGARGVWFNAASAGASMMLTNCYINQVWATSSGDGVGIYAPNCSKSAITGTRVLSIIGVSSTRSLWLTAASEVTVTGNVFEDQVMIEGALAGFNMTGNQITANQALATGAVRCVYSDGSSNVNISNNTITLPSTGASVSYGIEIAGSSATAEVRGIKAQGNLINGGTLGAIGVWFSVGESIGAHISDNVVRETTFNAGSRCVYLSSGTAFGHEGAIVKGNHFYGATKTAARGHAIFVSAVSHGSVEGNVVDVGGTSGGPYAGNGIRVENSQCNVCNNVVEGVSTEAGIHITGTAGSHFSMVSGNCVTSAGSFLTGIRAVGSSTVDYVGGVGVAHSTLEGEAGIVVYGYNLV